MWPFIYFIYHVPIYASLGCCHTFLISFSLLLFIFIFYQNQIACLNEKMKGGWKSQDLLTLGTMKLERGLLYHIWGV